MRKLRKLLIISAIITPYIVYAWPWVSPYAFCLNNPVNFVDPDGKDVYMLFYTTGNGRGDEMFKVSAETRKYDIEHSDFYNSENDIVLLYDIQDLANIGTIVENAITTYSDKYGKTAEFSIWSHAGYDGPVGTIPTSSNTLDKKQMTLEGWSSIEFNWAQNANANFYGCKTGLERNTTPSFSTNISTLQNFQDIFIHGQTSSAYPSIYTNVRYNTSNILQGIFSYPTYLVGGNSLGILGHLFPTQTIANPMSTSKNGQRITTNYYQPGNIY